MNAPKPMTTPNLADLLVRKPPTSSTTRRMPPAAAGEMATPNRVDVGELEPTASSPAGEPDPDLTAEEVPERTQVVASGEQREYLRSIALYLPRSLHQQLGSVATELGTTRTALILSAINSTHTRLGAALAAPTAPVRDKELFAVPQSKTETEPSVQTTIRVTDAQHAAISALVAEHRTNRSRLVATALHLHLVTK